MPSAVDHVVIMVQENHTTDNYFRSMAAYGANVATGWPVWPIPRRPTSRTTGMRTTAG